MHYTLTYSTTGYTSPQFSPGVIQATQTFEPSPSIYPFPISGKFRVRIVGYEFVSSETHNVGLMKVVSRTLVNPIQPDRIFQFIADGTIAGTTPPVQRQPARAFHPTGWWNIELNGNIDLKVYPDDQQGSGNNVAPFTFVMHLELEREGSGTAIEHGSHRRSRSPPHHHRRS